ncbi:TPM domain-containing protein [Lactovum odontotermitis]
MKKKLTSHAFSAVIVGLFMLLVLFAAPEKVSASAYNAGIEDTAQILSGNMDNLEQMVQDSADKTQSSVYIVTTNNETKVENFAKSYLRDKLSPSKSNDGVVLAINMNLRQVYIWSTGKMADYLPESRVNALLDQVQNDLSSGNYSQAASDFLAKIQTYYSAGIPDSAAANKKFTPLTALLTAILISVVLGAVVSVIFTVLTKRSYAMKDSTAQIFYDYQTNGQVQLTGRSDLLVNTYITRRELPQNNANNYSSSDGGSGGGRSF